MPLKSKTPAGTGALRDSFAGLSLPLSTPLAVQAQFLIAAHHTDLDDPFTADGFAQPSKVLIRSSPALLRFISCASQATIGTCWFRKFE